jgi:SAM-dependent methyltransferase
VELLRPGLSVLDIGCGGGAITTGIAEAVGPDGHVVGIDRDATLLDVARSEHGRVPNLRFLCEDVTTSAFFAEFDIVTAARTLQWIAQPALALLKMKQAVKPGGAIVVLDYNHAANSWSPDPPRSFQEFYGAFLAWREANGWDNEMADHLPELFRSAGLGDVQTHIQDELAQRGEPDFAQRSALWSEVIESLGDRIAAAGFCTELQWKEALRFFQQWRKTELMKQVLVMRTVTGMAP